MLYLYLGGSIRNSRFVDITHFILLYVKNILRVSRPCGGTAKALHNVFRRDMEVRRNEKRPNDDRISSHIIHTKGSLAVEFKSHSERLE